TSTGCAPGSACCSSSDAARGRTRPAHSTRRTASQVCSPPRASVTSSTCGATTPRTTGPPGARRSRIICPALSSPDHLVGLLRGTEDDWPRAFEGLVARLPSVEYRGQRHAFRTERVFNEPFDLRAKPRYALVIDRLGWWYDLAREWVKKCALMDE